MPPHFWGIIIQSQPEWRAALLLATPDFQTVHHPQYMSVQTWWNIILGMIVICSNQFLDKNIVSENQMRLNLNYRNSRISFVIFSKPQLITIKQRMAAFIILRIMKKKCAIYNSPLCNILIIFRLFPIISISQNFFSIFFLTLEKIGIDEKVICYHNISN